MKYWFFTLAFRRNGGGESESWNYTDMITAESPMSVIRTNRDLATKTGIVEEYAIVCAVEISADQYAQWKDR